MRIAFLAVLLLTAAAVAAPADKDQVKPILPESGVQIPHAPRAAAPGIPQAHTAHERVGYAGRPQGRPGDDKHIRRDRHHHDWDDDWEYPFPPYPETWPYPPSRYSQYYYPYPPQYYSGAYSDEEHDTHSTRGLTVPGDLPMGATVSYWYYCERPDGYYPYVKSCTRDWTRIAVSAPPPGMSPPMSYSDWQWCAASKGFFPYVSSCKAGFEPIHVTAPSTGTAGPPSAANWFFCEDPVGYAPYVVQCRRDWRPVPAVPPPSVKIAVKDGKTD